MKTNKSIDKIIKTDILQDFEMIELKGGIGMSTFNNSGPSGNGCRNTRCPGSGINCTNGTCIIDNLLFI